MVDTRFQMRANEGEKIEANVTEQKEG